MANVNHVKLTCPEATGLEDPFTGKPLEIFAHICDGIVTYSAPDAFSLRVPQLTVEKLLDRASTRKGIRGQAEGDDRLVDPYTKEQLTLVEDGGKYYFDGGFDPTVACLDLVEFIRVASCGTRVIAPPPEATSVEKIPDLTPNDDDAAHKVVDDLTEEAAHKIVDAIPGANKGRTTVGFREPAKGKHGK